MYLRHFALREAPFSITPDSAYYYPHEGAQAALNTLLVALHSGEGFLKVVGEVGCGKTLLCRQLLKSLPANFITAYIPNPDMGPDDLLHSLCHELGVDAGIQATRHQLLTALHECLIRHAKVGHSVVVCIDEAQAIPVRTVESLRLLSNLETEKRKLLQLVLLGQPELDVKLQRPEIRQLLQRITFSEYLGPMRPQRVHAYLTHRMATAALDENTDTAVFDSATAHAIATCSGGVPRLVNVLAHKCLMLAYGEDEHRVSLRHVRLALADTPGLKGKASRLRQWWRKLTAGHRHEAGAMDKANGEFL